MLPSLTQRKSQSLPKVYDDLGSICSLTSCLNTHTPALFSWVLLHCAPCSYTNRPGRLLPLHLCSSTPSVCSELPAGTTGLILHLFKSQWGLPKPLSEDHHLFPTPPHPSSPLPIPLTCSTFSFFSYCFSPLNIWSKVVCTLCYLVIFLSLV